MRTALCKNSPISWKHNNNLINLIIGLRKTRSRKQRSNPTCSKLISKSRWTQFKSKSSPFKFKPLIDELIPKSTRDPYI